MAAATRAPCRPPRHPRLPEIRPFRFQFRPAHSPAEFRPFQFWRLRQPVGRRERRRLQFRRFRLERRPFLFRQPGRRAPECPVCTGCVVNNVLVVLSSFSNSVAGLWCCGVGRSWKNTRSIRRVNVNTTTPNPGLAWFLTASPCLCSFVPQLCKARPPPVLGIHRLYIGIYVWHRLLTAYVLPSPRLVSNGATGPSRRRRRWTS